MIQAHFRFDAKIIREVNRYRSRQKRLFNRYNLNKISLATMNENLRILDLAYCLNIAKVRKFSKDSVLFN